MEKDSNVLVMSVKRSEIKGKKLRGKPKCPYCGRPLNFVYADAREGHIDQKCPNCKCSSWLDLKDMRAYRIEDDEVVCL